MKILLFGGTTEGRVLAQTLSAQGHAVTVSVATPLGAEELPGLPVRVGRLEAADMAALLQDCDLCIDATHPYADKASVNIRAACQTAKVPLRRVARPESGGTAGILVDSSQAAADCLKETTGNVLLTTGAKELSQFSHLDPARLYARVLPTHEGISACEAIGLPHRNMLALWGPFTKEVNAALIRQYQIKWLVTKDGGTAGGFQEKIQAAREAGAEVVLIRRPEDAGLTVEELLTEIEKEADQW